MRAMHVTARILAWGGMLLAGAATGWAQSNITLAADADTTIREHWPNDQRAAAVLENRSLLGETDGRQQIAYIRFDLRVLEEAPSAGTVFSITKTGSSQGFAAGQVHVYGLLDQFGNTAQGWVDNGLVYNTSGWEVPGDGNAGTQDLGTNRVVFLGDLPEASTANLEETLALSTAELDAFVADRHANGGLATLMLVQQEGANRILYFNNLEATNAPPPSLAVVGVMREPPADVTPPTVAWVSPTNGTVGVSLYSVVTAAFSEAMDEASITDGALALRDESGSLVPAIMTYNPAGLVLTLTPDAPLAPVNTHTATVRAGATDTAGNPLAADFSWSFTTEDADVVPPTVVTVSPTNGAPDVAYYEKVRAVFSEQMTAASISGDTFRLQTTSGSNVAATVVYDAVTFTATLAPAEVLALGETFTATVVGGAGGARDFAGNPLPADYVWSFTVPAYDPNAPLTLIPVADTSTRTGISAGAAENLDVRGFGGTDFIAYIRFDLSGLGILSVADATLTLHETGGSRNDVINNDRHEVYGLIDAAGNTPQDWDEATELDAGAEYDNTGGNGIDTNVVFVLDPQKGANVVETVPGSDNVDVTTSGPDLVAFLNQRLAAGGLVTFIVSIDSDNRGYGFAAKENLVAPPPRLLLRVVRNPPLTGIALAAGPAVIVSWEALAGHTYGVERTADALASAHWAPAASNLLGAVVNTYTDAAPVEAQISYRVVDEGPVEYFFDDFEGASTGWSVVAGSNHVAGTDWELGVPSTGPGAAYSGVNCYGTNLDDIYGPSADIGLLSPVIDLSTAAFASLSFANFFDTEALFDHCGVYVRDEAGGEIAGLEAPIAAYEDIIDPAEWRLETLSLPAEAVGRPIRIEFRFTCDEMAEYDGWYIDDVRVGG